jgi:hypothetical protein
MWKIQLDYVPNMQGIHYILAHWINLVMQVLFKLNMVCRLENLFKIVYPTLVKAPKGTWNSTSLPRSWKFMVISSWILSKQVDLYVKTYKKTDKWIFHYNGQNGLKVC